MYTNNIFANCTFINSYGYKSTLFYACYLFENLLKNIGLKKGKDVFWAYKILCFDELYMYRQKPTGYHERSDLLSFG
jgi:hypothetical protein